MKHPIAALTLLLAMLPAAAPAQVTFEDTIARLKLPDRAARLTAIHQLQEAGYVEAGGPIAPLMADPDDEVQRAAVYAELSLYLRTRIESRRYKAMIVEVRDAQPAMRIFESTWGALPVVPVPEAVVAGLLEPIKSANVSFRIESIYTLGLVGQLDNRRPTRAHGDVAQALAEKLGDPVPEVRVAAARAGGRIFRACPGTCDVPNLSRFGDALVHLLNDPDRHVRMAALEGLSDLRWDRAAQALAQAYDYFKKGDEALAYLSALSRIGHAMSVPVFQAALPRKEESFRAAAAAGLARVGGDAAKGVAATAGGDTSREVQAAAAFAEVRSTPGSSAIDRIAAALDSPTARSGAQQYLVELGAPAAAAAARALAGASGDARLALVEVISAVGDPAQLSAVEAVKGDRDLRVSEAAERAVLRLKAAGRK